MDYRTILATGFLLLCGAVFVHSLKSANAFPQGPNVSTGTNPIENFYGNSNSANITVTNDFIITTLMSTSSSCVLLLDGNSVYQASGGYNLFHYRWDQAANSPFTTGNARLKIEAGSTLSFSSCGQYYLEGYYTH